MKKITHIITGLNSGGAENMLYKLLKYADKNLYQHEVISLIDEGTIGAKIKAEGIKVHTLQLNKKNIIKSLYNAKEICSNSDIINTWLYHADLFGFIVSKILLRKKLIWNIRHSNLEVETNKRSTLNIVKLNAFLSKYTNSITYNSNSAFESHKLFGYRNKNSEIVSNGFELDRFKFDLSSRMKLRKEYNIKDEEKIIITVGRWNIQKDYYTLIKSLNHLYLQGMSYKLLMIGTDLDNNNLELKDLIQKNNLNGNIILLGRKDNIPDFLSAADIYVSSSLGESFSNAIGEAMACGLPCVVTDVGDSRDIIGDSGIAVKSQDYIELSSAINELMNSNNFNLLKERARKRVKDNYSINYIVKKYETFLGNNL